MKIDRIIKYLTSLVLLFVVIPSMGQQQDVVVDSTLKVDLEMNLHDSTLKVAVSGSEQDSVKLTAKQLRELKKAERERAKELTIGGEMVSQETLALVDSLIYVDVSDVEIKEEGEGQIPTLEAAWKPVLIDHYIGIRGGWGTGMIRREPVPETTTLPFSLWNFNLAYRFDVPEQKYVGTISFELGFMEKGFSYLLSYGGDVEYMRQFSVIEFPILWQPYLPLGKGSRFHLSLGPFLSYTLNSWEKQHNIATGEIYFEREYVLDPLIDYFWGFGITLGAGVVISVDKFLISLEGRYTIQLSDVLRGPEYVDNAPFRSPVDHMGGTIGIYYKFSDGKEQQRKKTLQKLRNLNIEGL